jgi:16S rRNA G966 N2-methylase RsmD
MEKDEKKLNMALNNFNVYKVKSKIDILRANFVESFLEVKPVDIIFLYPNYETFNLTQNDKFCLFNNIFPDLRKILDAAMGITENMIIILPKTVEIEELALLFSDFFESYQRLRKIRISFCLFSNLS